MPNFNDNIYYEVSKFFISPYLPTQFRKTVFESRHCLSHPDVRTTRKLMSKKIFWPSMNKDFGN